MPLTKHGFELLFKEHRAAVLAFSMRRVGLDDARDVVADTFLVAWRRPDQIPAEPLPWLLTIARNVISTNHRGARRRGNLKLRIVQQGSARASLSDPERLDIADAFKALPERDREVLMLVAWDGLGISEAATVLGCTARSFSVRLHRARKRLEALLGEDDVERAPLATHMEDSQ